MPDYGDQYAAIYDALYGDRDDPETVGALLADLAGQGPALEFGIGTGRTAWPLLARGVPVHGIESSPAMLAKLRERASADEVPVTLGDMATADAPGGRRYTLVYCTFSSLFLLPDQAAQVATFRNAARHLVRGGAFLVECFVPDPSRWVRGQLVEVRHVGADGLVLYGARHDRTTQVIETQELTITTAGLVPRANRLRYAWPAELDLMAQLAGFTLEAQWAGWRRERFSHESGQRLSVYRAR